MDSNESRKCQAEPHFPDDWPEEPVHRLGEMLYIKRAGVYRISGRGVGLDVKLKEGDVVRIGMAPLSADSEGGEA